MQHLKRCPNGHFYDPQNHTACPHCEDMDEERIVSEDFPKTFSLGSAEPFGSDDTRTVGVTPQKLGVDPVVGWLVCITGVNRGRDWRLHAERNFIGRGDSMDVRITGDNAISRENHACLSYDARNGIYSIIPGVSRNIVYLNDKELSSPAELKSGDHIEIGKSIFIFVPLCTGDFHWSDE